MHKLTEHAQPPVAIHPSTCPACEIEAFVLLLQLIRRKRILRQRQAFERQHPRGSGAKARAAAQEHVQGLNVISQLYEGSRFTPITHGMARQRGKCCTCMVGPTSSHHPLFTGI